MNAAGYGLDCFHINLSTSAYFFKDVSGGGNIFVFPKFWNTELTVLQNLSGGRNISLNFRVIFKQILNRGIPLKWERKVWEA